MAFANYYFAHIFRFTGNAVSAAYIDLSARGGPALQKTLVNVPPSDEWLLELTETETTPYLNLCLEGHLVIVDDDDQHTPVALVKINVTRSLTERRP